MKIPTSTKTPYPALGAAFATVMICLPAVALAQTAPLPAQPRTSAPARPKPAPQPVVQTPAAQPPTTQGLAPSSNAAGSDGDVVARVGSSNISAAEVRTYISALGAREQAALAQDPAQLSQVVRMLLANRLVLQELTARKWDRQANIVEQIERVRENALVEIYLQSVSSPPDSFPGEEELQRTYDANRAALVMPRQFQLAQIFVAIPKDADKAAEDKAKKSLGDIQAKLKAPGADFTSVAQAENDARDGGDLGWLAETQIRPEIRAQLAGLAKNAVSEPVRLDDGWHVLKLIDTKASYTRTLPEVREQLVQQMRSERATALRRAYLAELLKQHPPILNELALSSLLDTSRK
jgi:peptidylprolyl isomerase